MSFTAEEIRAKLATAPLRTTRLRLSVPVVNRFVGMLRSGRTPPPIDVAGSVIVDGAYRYVAGLMCDRLPPIRKVATAPEGLVALRFAQVILDPVNHETATKAEAYAEIGQTVPLRPPPPPPRARPTSRRRAKASKPRSRSSP